MNVYELGCQALLEVEELADRIERLSETLEIPRSASVDLRSAATELRTLRAVVVSLRMSGYDA